MFGVIMVVCFTSILRTNAVLAELIVWRVIEAALACCVAWGLVDGIFYAWELHYERNKMEKLVSISKSSASSEVTMSLLKENLEDTIVGTLDDNDKVQLYGRLLEKIRGAEVGKVPMRNSVITILVTFGLVVGTAILVLMPFVLIPHVATALICSNSMGIALLFFTGYWREEDTRISMKLKSGLMTAFVALIITLVTVYLGG